ncbi:MAG: hypothetical protein D6706_05655, partial [Chloroflexi bacterium]
MTDLVNGVLVVMVAMLEPAIAVGVIVFAIVKKQSGGYGLPFLAGTAVFLLAYVVCIAAFGMVLSAIKSANNGDTVTKKVGKGRLVGVVQSGNEIIKYYESGRVSRVKIKNGGG